MNRKRGRYATTALRRRSLSQATLVLVQEKGHRAVTIAQVAELAGVTEPTVFYHFPTKESLLIAALQEFDDEHIRPAGSEAGAIADMGRRAEVGVRRKHISLLYAEMAGAAVDRKHPANSYFQERWSRSLHVVSTDIQRLQDAGIVPLDVDSQHVARILLAVWEGLQFQWLHGPEFDIKTELELTIKDVLRVSQLSDLNTDQTGFDNLDPTAE